MFLINKHFTITTYTPFRMWYFLIFLSSLSFFNGTYFKTLGKTVMALCLPFLKRDSIVQHIITGKFCVQLNARAQWGKDILNLADNSSPKVQREVYGDFIQFCLLQSNKVLENQELVRKYHCIAYFLATITIVIMHVLIFVLYFLLIEHQLFGLHINIYNATNWVVVLNMLVLVCRLMSLQSDYVFFKNDTMLIVFGVVNLDDKTMEQINDLVTKLRDVISIQFYPIIIGFKYDSELGFYSVKRIVPSQEEVDGYIWKYIRDGKTKVKRIFMEFFFSGGSNNDPGYFNPESLKKSSLYRDPIKTPDYEPW